MNQSAHGLHACAGHNHDANPKAITGGSGAASPERDKVRVASRHPDGQSLTLTDLAPPTQRISADSASHNLRSAGPVHTLDSQIYKSTPSANDELYRSAATYAVTGGLAVMAHGTDVSDTYISTWAGDTLVHESRANGRVEMFHDVTYGQSGRKWWDFRLPPDHIQGMNCWVCF